MFIATATCGNKNGVVGLLTISVLQASTLTTDYGIPSDFARKSTASLQIKISTAQLNFSNRNVIIYSECRIIINTDNESQIKYYDGVYSPFISQFVLHHHRVVGLSTISVQ